MNILQMSVSAAILILAIVIIRAVTLIQLPKTMFLILWSVALIRLLIPFSIQTQFSIYNTIHKMQNQALPHTLTNITETVLPIGNHNVGATGQLASTGLTQGVLIQWQTILWFAVTLTLFIFFAIVYFHNCRELRFALPVTNNSYIESWLKEYRLMRPITILQTDRITTPIAIGIARPRIILPKTMNMGDTQLMRYVLTHEYYHIKRFDMLWKIFLIITICIHWFNPMVWVMFILLNRDLELACDEMVVRHFGETSRTAYAYSLIGMAEQRNKFTPLYNDFNKNATVERITAIMKYRKSSRITILLAILIVFAVTTAFASSAVGKTSERNTSVTNVATVEPSQSTSDEQPPLAEYSNYAISYDKNGKMLYNGKMVRYFWDGAIIDSSSTVSRYEYLNEHGVIDVHTIRSIIHNGDGSYDPFGELTDIIEYSQQEYDARDITPLKETAVASQLTNKAITNNDIILSEQAIIASNVGPQDTSSDEHGQTLVQIFAKLKEFGIEYIEPTNGGLGNLYYQSELVKTFVDESTDGSFTFQSTDGGDVVVQTVYDKTGNLTGVETK